MRPVNFFDGTSIMAYVTFGEPFSVRLMRWLERAVEHALAESVDRERKQEQWVGLHRDASSERILSLLPGPGTWST